MRLVPESNNGKVDFYRLRLNAWQQHAETLGFSQERVAGLQSEVDAAEAALREQRLAQQAAKAATLNAQLAIERLCRTGSSMTKCIRARGDIEGNDVFVLAQIPPPKKTKTPIGPPSTPTAFRTELLASGWLKLTWKCTTPRGAGRTLYYLSRRLNASGPFERVGFVGKKVYVDMTIPPGTTSVEYRVSPERTTGKGEAGQHVVNLASSGVLPAFQVTKRAA